MHRHLRAVPAIFVHGISRCSRSKELSNHVRFLKPHCPRQRGLLFVVNGRFEINAKFQQFPDDRLVATSNGELTLL